MHLAAIPRIPWPSRRILLASLWFLIATVPGIVIIALLHGQRPMEKSGYSPPVRFEELKIAASLFYVFFAGASLGAAIETVTNRFRYLAIAGIFLGPLVLTVAIVLISILLEAIH